MLDNLIAEPMQMSAVIDEGGNEQPPEGVVSQVGVNDSIHAYMHIEYAHTCCYALTINSDVMIS